MNLINENDFKEVSKCLNDIVKKVVKKENSRLYAIKYRQDNKKKLKENDRKRSKKYREENKKKIQLDKKKWGLTSNGKKSRKISDWKRNGLISDDYDFIYNKYINTSNCDNCNCVLTIDRYITSTTKCMDHEHNSGLFRNILCNACNVKRK